jgi:hypothetical protein
LSLLHRLLEDDPVVVAPLLLNKVLVVGGVPA